MEKSNKKPQSHAHPEQEDSAPQHCLATHCKQTPKQFNFCNEHYAQFKFGLIKKSGEPVLDYEKKLQHYEKHHKSHKHRQAA